MTYLDVFYFMRKQCPRYAEDEPCDCKPDLDWPWIDHYRVPLSLIYSNLFSEHHSWEHFLKFAQANSSRKYLSPFVDLDQR